MNPSYNEREVLELLQDESTQKRGFELIVAQYSEQLYWQIRRMVLLHEDANDLLQNTFIKACIIRKSKFPQNPKRSVRFSGKRTKRSVQKRKARNTQKAETKVL